MMAALGDYIGQVRDLRKLAIEKLGAEKAAPMTDEEISSWVEDNYAIFWGDDDQLGSHKPTREIIALVDDKAFDELGKNGSIVFITR